MYKRQAQNSCQFRVQNLDLYSFLIHIVKRNVVDTVPLDQMCIRDSVTGGNSLLFFPKVITMSGKEVEFIPLLVSALKQEGIAGDVYKRQAPSIWATSSAPRV